MITVLFSNKKPCLHGYNTVKTWDKITAITRLITVGFSN
jgi:hypothetical protein